MTERLDGGEILAQRRIAVPPEEDSVDVYLRCGAAAREMLEEVLGDFEGGLEGGHGVRRTGCPTGGALPRGF